MVFHRDQRQADTGHAANFAGPEPCRVDHVFGTDGTLVGDHLPAAVALGHEFDDARVAVDLRAGATGGGGKGMGRAGRIEVPLARIVDCAEDVLRLGDWAQSAHLVWPDELGLKPDHALPRPLGLEKLPALGGRGQAQAAGKMDARVLAWIR